MLNVLLEIGFFFLTYVDIPIIPYLYFVVGYSQ